MSIIYSYPEQGALNANDLLIGTSAEKVGGKQKNITRNFSIQQIADFINRGAGFVDPVASDFQIPVFNQEGKKITGSIMSQDSSPSNGAAGSAITIAGSLVTTGDLTSPGVVTIGGGTNLITLNSETYLKGSLRDSANVLGADKQILLSDQFGYTTWTNYEAGLTYEGTWDANANTTNGLSNSPALLQGAGVSGHFYIVNVEGTTSLGPGLNDWHVGDWAIFLDEGGQPASWQKIDNTSTLVGSGTAGTFAKWTNATTLNDSIMSESGTVVSVDGDLKVKDTVEATTTNSNLKLKGNGTGGVEIMSADGTTDGKITLNCSQNSHGVTLQSPPHASGATYTLILPTSFGGAGDVLTSAGANPSQLVWTTPTTGTVTGTGTENYVTKWSAGGTGIENSTIFDNGTNVGIGTNSPLAKTQISTTLSSGSTQNALLLSQNTSTSASGQGVKMFLSSSNSVTRAAAIEAIAGSSNDHSLGFYTNSAFSNPTEKMRIDSSGNVGIGTSSPADKLHVVGRTKMEGTLFVENTNNQIRIVDSDSSGNFSVGVNTHFQIRDMAGSTTPVTVQAGAPSSTLFLKSSGDVGIGTTSPSGKVHVYEGPSGQSSPDVSANTLVLEDDVSNGLSILTPDTGIGSIFFGDNNDNFVGGFRYDHSDDSLKINVNNASALYIDSTRKVGIGTTSPSRDLTVNSGNQQVTALIESTSSTSTQINIRNSNSNNGGFIKTTGDNVILTANNTGISHLVVADGGNVGIGTTSPAVSLDISATDAVQMPVGITTDRPLTGVSNGMLRYNSTNNEFEGYINGNWGSIGGGASGGLVFRGTFDASTGAIASGGSLYTCPAGGSGGTVDTAIGDLYIVTTAGSFFCSGTSLNVGDEVICITAATATNDNVNNWNAIASGAGGAVTGSGTTNYVPKFTGATVVGNSSIFNDASGNVGIGTAGPRTKFHVVKPGGGAPPVLGADAYTAHFGGGLFGTLFSTLSSGKGVIQQGRVDGTATAYDLLIQPTGGNVGIGTDSPSAKLDVAGGTDNLVAVFSSTDDVAQIQIVDNDTSTFLGSKDGLSYISQTAGTPSDGLVVDSSGNVGIGTDSPVKTLEVKSTGNTAIRISTDGDAGDQPEIQFYRNIGDYAVVKHKPGGGSTSGLILTNYRLEDSNIIFNTAGENERMRIDSSGNVGIGTESPGAKLEVKNGSSGQVYSNVEGILIDTNGNSNSDYSLRIGSSAGNDNLVVTNAGRVGIGTDSPEVSLDLGNNTDAIRVPNGAQADRPSGILPGMIRYNTSSNEFEGYSGTLNVSGSWGALGGGSLPTKTVDTFTGSGQSFIDLTVEASSVNYIDMYIDGVYQAKATYTIATPGGTGISRLTLVSGTFPTGVSIETVTTT